MTSDPIAKRGIERASCLMRVQEKCNYFKYMEINNNSENRLDPGIPSRNGFIGTMNAPPILSIEPLYGRSLEHL